MRTIPLSMEPDVRSIRGTLKEVIAQADDDNRNDYVSITLTDEEIFRPKDQLEEHYPHILEVKIDNRKMQAVLTEDTEEDLVDPKAAFMQFYKEINGAFPNEDEEKIILDVLESVKQRMESEG